MNPYVRPTVVEQEFRDADGNVVNYGSRWEHLGGTPPEDSYSVDENTERFEPLHTIANALIDHLAANYEVEVEEGPEVLDGLGVYVPESANVVRAVRLAPRREGSASLVIALDTYPSVRVWAGELFSTPFPSCGCNACDETWYHPAEDLELKVFAVVTGGLREEVGPPKQARTRWERGGGFVRDMGQTVSWSIRSADGELEESSHWPASDMPKDELATLSRTLKTLKRLSPEGNWLPWERKRMSASNDS